MNSGEDLELRAAIKSEPGADRGPRRSSRAGVVVATGAGTQVRLLLAFLGFDHLGKTMRELLENTAQRAISYLDGLGDRGVAPLPEAVAKLAILDEASACLVYEASPQGV